MGALVVRVPAPDWVWWLVLAIATALATLQARLLLRQHWR
jgi:hypothetical protein